MYSYGINIGHGHCKAVVLDPQGQETVMRPFPSQIALAGDTGDLGTALTVTRDHQSYWVGDDAALGSIVTMYDQQRLQDPIFIPALTAAVVQRLPAINLGVCFTCLPASWNMEQARHDLGSRVREGSGGAFLRIGVISEPQAVAFAQMLDPVGTFVGDEVLQQGRVGIVDLGSGTLDLSIMAHMNLEPDSAKTWRTGMIKALSTIQSMVNATFDTDFSLSAIDQAVRQRVVRVAGKERALPPGWDAPLHRLAQTLVAELGQAWGSGNNLDRILLAGGGSAEPIIAEAIRHKFPHAVVVDDPQHAIARGCARRARALVAQMAMEQAA